MLYRLTGLVGDGLRSWDLKQGPNRIGRSSDLEIVLQDRSVSRQHAVLRRDGDTLVLEDLGSRNGTSINGLRLESPHPVKPGDDIAFGNVTLKLATEEAVQPALSEHTQLDSTFKMNWREIQQVPDASAREGPSLLQVMSDLGEFLVNPQPAEEMYEACLDAVEKLVPFQRACLLMLREDGKPEMQAARTRGDSSKLELALSHTMVETVINERASLLVRDAQSDTRFQLQQSVILGKIRSALVAPLFDNRQVIGVLYVDTSDLSHPYDKEHLRRLALLANILAVKITNARLLEDQREKERMQQEMNTAARIQRTLLDAAPPAPAGYELSVRLEPCTEVGGDLYDVVPLSDGRWAIVLADVVGHGVGAAMLMANALAGIRALADLCRDPVDLVERLHDQMLRSTETTSYLTLVTGILDPVRHRFDYVNAGHQELPLVVVPGKEPVALDSTGPPVGLLPGVEFEAGSVDIPAGGLLCIWSDGVTEAHVPPEGDADPDFFGERYSMAGLLRELWDHGLDEIADGIFDRVDDFLQGRGAPDDRTLLLLRRTG